MPWSEGTWWPGGVELPTSSLLGVFRLCGQCCESARRPAQRRGGCDRGCPLDTRVARPLWHACGTAGEDERGSDLSTSASARAQGEARPQGTTCLVGKLTVGR